MITQSVYIETSVVSYYAAKRSRDLIIAARQEITVEWWDTKLAEFEPFISPLVLREARSGDSVAAKKRLEALKAVEVLELNDDVLMLAKSLVETGPIPIEYADDAIHIAVSAVNGIEFLVTWNCKHIANAQMRPKIINIVESQNYEPPVICTPEELMGE